MATILIIGAEADVSAAFATAVARVAPGAQVTSVEPGGSALAQALEDVRRVAMVAVCLDRTEAPALAAWLRARPATRGAALVALTSGTRPDTLIEAETAGFSAFVFTPVDPARLDRVLPGLLGGAPPEMSPAGRIG